MQKTWKKNTFSTEEVEKINTLFKNALDMALLEEPMLTKSLQKPLEDEPVTWNDNEDYVLMENYKHLHDNMGLRNEPLWNILRSRMAVDYQYTSTYTSKTRLEYKLRVQELLEIEKFNENLENELNTCDNDSTNDENGSDYDYFNDPNANYCDFCTLNVFDCVC